MSETYSVCAFCGAQHHDTITTPCCLAQANCELAEAQSAIETMKKTGQANYDCGWVDGIEHQKKEQSK